MGRKKMSLEDTISEFRRVLPSGSATARAIDQGEPVEQVTLKAIDDGYIEFSRDCARLMEMSLRRGT